MTSPDDDDRPRPAPPVAAAVWWIGYLFVSVAQFSMAFDGFNRSGARPGIGDPTASVALGVWALGFVLTAAAFIVIDVSVNGAGRRPPSRANAYARVSPYGAGFFGWLLSMSCGLMVATVPLLLRRVDAAIWVAALLAGVLSPLVGVIAFFRVFEPAPAVVREEVAVADAAALVEEAPEGADARYAVLDREGRSQEAWRAALRTLLTAESYRGVSVTREDLLRVLEDPRGPAQRRIAAALALADAPDALTVIRARTAAEGAEGKVRVALTGALDGALEERDIDAALDDERSGRRGA
jgi:hypothetical protein